MKKSPPRIFLILIACLFPRLYQGCGNDRAQTDAEGLHGGNDKGLQLAHGQMPLRIGIEN
jgi:hypothetical protein